jgi:hypothetical protein
MTYTFHAVDPEQDVPTYAIVSGPGSINATTGAWEYMPTLADVGQSITLVVSACDPPGKGGCSEATVNIVVTDAAPVLTCPTAQKLVSLGDCKDQTITATDECQDPIHFVLDANTPIVPADAGITATIDPNTGVLHFCASLTATTQDYEVIVYASDTKDSSVCRVPYKVIAGCPYQLKIAKVEDVLQGHYWTVPITLVKGDAAQGLGGFDLVIAYDQSALSFQSAALGQALKDCGWEYFTYRYNWNGNCGTGCPSGLVRLVGLAETNNGPSHPDPICLSNLTGKGIATLTFLVSNDRTLECMYLPVRFYWMTCTDNTMSDLTGDTLYMARNIFNFDDNPLEPTDAINYGLNVTEDGPFWPGWYGWAIECWPGQGPDIKQYPLVYLDFIDGGIDVACADSIDARGDINLNGIPNEIADAVMFTNYFIMGVTAFGETAEASIAASDVNSDGIALSVADLVYLIRVIVGDALPYPKPVPGSSFAVTTQVLNGQMSVNYNATSEVGAVLLTFSGSVGTPVLGNGAQSMDVVYSDTKVLVYNIGHNAIAAGDNVLLTVPVDGSVELVGVEAADYNGGAMETTTRTLPSEYAVSQNYPNPFNPTTTIALSLPTASKWNLAIYNVAGQLVKDFSGNDAAGNITVVWDGTDNNGASVASGIYFYKVVASNFSATKKMVLMK